MSGPCPTLDSLIELGFKRWQGQRRSRSVGEGVADALFAMHGLREPASGTDAVVYPFADFDLFCSHTMNRYMGMAVRVHGVIYTGRTLSEIDSEIPDHLESPLQAAAWVSYVLESYKGELGPLPDWFVKGEENWDVIPFVRDQREYEARPRCLITREDARPIRRSLVEGLARLDGETEMTVRFDGHALNIVLCDHFYGAIAFGDSWPYSYQVTVSPSTRLPARFRSSLVEVSAYGGYVRLDGYKLGPCKSIT